MKLIMLCCCLAVCALSDTAVATRNNTVYYFFSSRAVNQKSVEGKQYAIYTDIKQMPNDVQRIKVLTKAWADKVNGDCKNQAGCTSDLNTYPTAADAEKQWNGFVRKYSDTDKYVLTKQDF
ncbi:hypothetical protein [Sediminibacterium goheungense]|uniref:Uncharacterized protein n=1 Tax=Sediminibacterium goheungense TaxID=1086393 RepID=A0A4R6IZU4_9BACT|nr:hypothetical protein [Sediminibacterium goheungense]TDO28037.1 hypothetical protein BC659_0095 [Sediminibacterium goheungense]